MPMLEEPLARITFLSIARCGWLAAASARVAPANSPARIGLPLAAVRVGKGCRPAGLAWLWRAALGLAVGVLLLLGGSGSGSAGTISLQPHRAIYKMGLARNSGRSDVIAASGSMFYRFAQGCDGWTVENRTVLHLSYETGGDVETVWSFASWESADGLKFRFYARYEQDGTQMERLEGRASLVAPGGGGSVEFSEPEGRTVTLPKGTMFPTEHLRALIAAAERGEVRLTRVVFDGASADNPYLVAAMMGPLAAADTGELAAKTKLPSLPAWWTQMAFFPYLHQEANPEFEIGAQYRADGIADKIVQRFDTFALDARLSEFEVLGRPDC